MDAEAHVIGGILIDPQAFWRVSDLVKAEHFTNASHRRLWARRTVSRPRP